MPKVKARTVRLLLVDDHEVGEQADPEPLLMVPAKDVRVEDIPLVRLPDPRPELAAELDHCHRLA